MASLYLGEHSSYLGENKEEHAEAKSGFFSETRIEKQTNV
jgi:hypothetical protein